jgi:para-nitrobenzyl esterase
MRASAGPPSGDAYMACPICFEVFESVGARRPRVLDCNHSFCIECIRRWEHQTAQQGGEPMTCPLCRQLTAEMTPQSPTESQESLEDSMRMVWLGPEGVAWVSSDRTGNTALSTRILKSVLCGGLLIIIGLVAAIAVLVVQQNNGGSTPGPTPQDKNFDLLVHTSLGKIQGHLVDYGDGSLKPEETARVFQGVPFAEPPIGEKRFRSATPKLPWGGVLHADADGAMCMQDDHRMTGSKMSEDCLILNIWTPSQLSPTMRGTHRRHGAHGPIMPVMVWIHGGAFHWGSAGENDGGKLALATGAIVVAVQYRLGPLGFFQNEEIAREDLQFPSHGGANGIYDMIMALRWVQQHALAFGGDSNRITVFGDGLGGGLGVCSLVVSPWSEGLFQRAVISSGPCNGPWRPWNAVEALANSARLMHSLNATTLADMRSVNSSKLLCSHAAYGTVNAPWQCSVDYAIDNWVIPTQPYELFGADGRIGFDIMIGATTADTLAGPPYFRGTQPQTINSLRTMLTQLIAKVTKDPTTAKHQADLIIAQYSHPHDHDQQQSQRAEQEQGGLPPSPPSPASVRMWEQINADVCVICPTKQLADDMSTSEHTQGGPTPYVYQYAGAAAGGMAPHYSDTYMLFGQTSPRGGSEPFDPQLSATIQQYWGSFAAHGAPQRLPGASQPNGEPVPVWPVYFATNGSSKAGGGGGGGGGVMGRNQLFMKLAPDVSLHSGYEVTTPCAFWGGNGNFTKTIQEHLCYETNPTPRRTRLWEAQQWQQHRQQASDSGDDASTESSLQQHREKSGEELAKEEV